MRRPRILVPLLLAVAVIAYAIYWSWAATFVRSGIDQWMADMRAQQAAVTVADLAVEGFPFEIRAEARDYRLQPGGGFTVEGALLRAGATPLSWHWPPLPRRIGIELVGEQRLTLPYDPGGPLAFTAEGGRGLIELAGSGEPTGATLTLDRLVGRDPVISEPLTVERLEVTAQQPTLFRSC